MYTWGDGRLGQLGQIHEGFVNQPTPRIVRSLSAFIVQVACGQGHTVALTNNGKMYSWGYSRFGQTGHGDRQQVKVPKLVDTERNLEFVQIACGDKHTVALTSKAFSCCSIQLQITMMSYCPSICCRTRQGGDFRMWRTWAVGSWRPK